MYLNDRVTMLAGIVLILAGLLLIVFLAASISVGDKSPFEDDEVAEFLLDVNDNEDAMIIAGATGVIQDGFLIPALAVLLYILFRDRSRLLALATLIGFISSSVMAMVVDGSNLLLIIVADDFVNGGQGGVDAGDPSALEAGRVLAMTTFAFTNVSFTPLGLGMVSLGGILTFSPAGAITPPRFLGWLAIIAGLASWLAWFVVIADVAFVFFLIQALAIFMLVFGLGIWLLANRNLQPGVQPGIAAG